LNSSSSIYCGACGGTTLGHVLVGAPSFSLGGSNGFAAYGENEPLTNQYYILQAGYLRKLAKFPVLLGEGLHTSMARPKSERSFRLHSNPKFRPSQLQ
jgi:hypothetical protein